MGRRTKIALAAGAAVLLVLLGVTFAYDSSQDGKIADGVTIGGVDVGGMDEAEAKRAVRRELLLPLRHSLRVGYDGESWKLDGASLKVHANLDRAVEEALDKSRSGGLPGRLARYVTGGEVDENVPARVAYSRAAVDRFVRHVADEVDREAQDAAVEPSGESLAVAPAKWGRKLRDRLLARQLRAAVLNAGADHTIAARTHPVKPEVTAREVAAEYPSYLTLDRATFTLRLWEHLKLAKAYTVAVGQEGLETPEGLYAIRKRKKTPPGTCPTRPGPATWRAR